MAIPGEDFVLRLREGRPSLLHMNVLDVCITGVADSLVLVEWAYGVGPTVDMAGFSLLRLDPLGNLRWQLSRTLCNGDGTGCGRWVLERGSLCLGIDGCVIAGTSTNVDSGDIQIFTIGVSDAGAVKWARRYYPNLTGKGAPRITSIVRMNTPDRWLISACNDENTALIQIDSIGTAAQASLLEFTYVHRLRAMPTQGICAVGNALFGLDTLGGLLMSLGEATGVPHWERIHTTTPGGSSGLRWYDIAEGNDSLLLVGNMLDGTAELSPMMASVNTDRLSPGIAGYVRWASAPTLGDAPIRLRGVVNHQDVIVPVGPIDRTSAFTVCGEAQQRPWLFVMSEDRTVQWQKALRTAAGTTGQLAPMVWPSYDQIVAGGQVTAGSVSRGFLVASREVIDRGRSHCSLQTDVAFPDQPLATDVRSSTVYNLNVFDLDLLLGQGPDLMLANGCLDAQDGQPPTEQQERGRSRASGP